MFSHCICVETCRDPATFFSEVQFGTLFQEHLTFCRHVNHMHSPKQEAPVAIFAPGSSFGSKI